MQLTIPLGSKISQAEDKTIQINIPHTKFFVLGLQKPSKRWDLYLVDSQSEYKEIFYKDMHTRGFSLFSALILKTPFPHQGKKALDHKSIKRFIKKLIK
jgi:predicted secreted protein